MRQLIFSTLFSAFAVSGAANAQALVIGSSVGKACYEAALASDPSFPSTTREGVCDDAIRSSTISSRDLAATYINRGIIRMHKNKLEDAISDYEKASQLRPDLGAIYLNQGAAMIRAGRGADAIAALEKALALGTQDAHAAYYNLGLAHELDGDLTQAYYAFQKALDLLPDWPLAKDQLKRFTVISN